MLAGTIRLHAVIPPLAAEGTLISLRIHRPVGMTVKDLAERGMIHREIVPVVMALIQHKANVMISGATGSGKTTFLSAALGEIPSDQRIIIIEEAPELRPTHPHVVHLRERRPNVEGAGAVPMSELVRAAMRMRPDRIILGECRGPEVRDVLSALNTGHDGGWATIHANSAADVPSRLVALGATAGMSESFTYLQANAALDAIVHLEKRRHPAHHSAIRVLSQIAVLRARGASIEAIPAVMLCGNECCRGPGWEDLVRRVGGNMEGAKGVEKSLRIAPEDCVSPTDARC